MNTYIFIIFLQTLIIYLTKWEMVYLKVLRIILKQQYTISKNLM